MAVDLRAMMQDVGMNVFQQSALIDLIAPYVEGNPTVPLNPDKGGAFFLDAEKTPWGEAIVYIEHCAIRNEKYKEFTPGDRDRVATAIFLEVFPFIARSGTSYDPKLNELYAFFMKQQQWSSEPYKENTRQWYAAVGDSWMEPAYVVHFLDACQMGNGKRTEGVSNCLQKSIHIVRHEALIN